MTRAVGFEPVLDELGIYEFANERGRECADFCVEGLVLNFGGDFPSLFEVQPRLTDEGLGYFLGVPLGESIAAGYFDAQADAAKRFMDWLRRTLDIPQNEE